MERILDVNELGVTSPYPTVVNVTTTNHRLSNSPKEGSIKNRAKVKMITVKTIHVRTLSNFVAKTVP